MDLVRCRVRCPQRKSSAMTFNCRPKNSAPYSSRGAELLRAVRSSFERLVSQFAGDDFLQRNVR